MRLIDGDALYEHAAEHEKDAIETIIMLRDSKEQSMLWFTILVERSVFKFDVMDAPTVDIPDWQSVVEAATNTLQKWLDDSSNGIESTAYADCLSMLKELVYEYIPKEYLK